MLLTLALVLAVGTETKPCVVLQAPRITAADLAGTFPELAVLGQAPLLPAPRIGARRILSGEEVRRLAAASGFALAAARPVCFERAGRPLAETEVAAALRTALGEAQFELTGFSRAPVPPGVLVFESALRRTSATESLARGWVQEVSGDRYPVWARLRATRRGRWLEAAVPIAAGQRINPGFVRMVEGPVAGPARADPEDLLGKVARRSLPAGTVLARAHVAEPPLVERGQTVRVEAGVGGVVVGFAARAETAARLRDTILVRSTAGPGRRLRAVVTGEGQARIETGNQGGRR